MNENPIAAVARINQNPISAVVKAWDDFALAMDCSDASGEMTERQQALFLAVDAAIDSVHSACRRGGTVSGFDAEPDGGGTNKED